MTPIDLLIFAFGVGVGCCAGWMLGAIAGRRAARAERPVSVRRTQRVFLPTDYPDGLDYLDELDPSCVMPPPAPEPTDWEDFEQRTALRDTERTYGLPPSGWNSKMGGFGY